MVRAFVSSKGLSLIVAQFESTDFRHGASPRTLVQFYSWLPVITITACTVTCSDIATENSHTIDIDTFVLRTLRRRGQHIRESKEVRLRPSQFIDYYEKMVVDVNELTPLAGKLVERLSLLRSEECNAGWQRSTNG
jgi:hypothetical protein